MSGVSRVRREPSPECVRRSLWRFRNQGGWITRMGRLVTSGIAVAALFCASFGLISPATAQTIGSSYTSTAPKDCHVTSAGNGVDGSTIRVCPGKAGLVVLVSEDDLRETVSVGRNRAAAASEAAARGWFGPFHS